MPYDSDIENSASIAKVVFGKFIDLSFDEYLIHPGISRSDLEKIRLTPFHFKYFKENPQPETASMQFGQALHAKLLGGFEDGFAVWDGAVRRGKAFDAFKLTNEDKKIITLKDSELIDQIIGNVFENNFVRNLLSLAKKEVSIEFKNMGVRCKARLDGYTPMTAFDVKTITDIDRVDQAIINYGYHRQAAWYIDALKAAGEKTVSNFVFIFIEKAAPFSVRLVELDQTFLELGSKQNEDSLALYKECLAQNEWPGWPMVIEKIECPEWLLNKELLNERIN